MDVHLDQYQSRAFVEVGPGKTVILCMGRGSGKTWLLSLLIHKIALEKKRNIGLLMPSLKQARAVFWLPHLLPAYQGDLRHHIVGAPNMSDLAVTYRNGSRLSTWGFENAGSIRGQRFDALIQDETDDMSKELESAIVTPTLSRSGRNAIVVKAGTYTRGRYGILYRDMKLADAGEPGYYGIRVTSEQSPQVDHEWLVSQKRRTNPRTYDREYLINPDSGEGLVYPHFVEVATDDGFTHVAEPHPSTIWSEIVVGVDWGFEHPGSFIVCGAIGSGDDTTVHVIEEVYASGYTSDWWDKQAECIRDRYPNARWYAGPDRPERIEQMRAKVGMNIRGADNSVKEGIDTVANLLSVCEHPDAGRYSHMFISKRCPNLIREFGLYRRRPDNIRAAGGEVQFSDEVVKINDDAQDALRYAVHSRFGKALSTRRTRDASTLYQDS